MTSALKELVAMSRYAKSQGCSLAQAKAILSQLPTGIPSSPSTISTSVEKAVESATQIQSTPSHHAGTDRYGNPIEWNEEQWQFITTAKEGNSCILIGAAGTGKTTTMRGTVEEILRTKFIPPLEAAHKYLSSQAPGIVAISYTRRAVQNLRKAMPPELVPQCITIHKLLEYQPIFYEIIDPVSGETRKTMKFEPNRHRYNPLPESIKLVIIDESSMVSVDLFAQLKLALPHNPQFIFLGDIQQLPPVFGSAILGYKLLTLPVVELTQVYRQALESPIIRLAHRILSGNPILHAEFPEWKYPNQLTLHPWKKRISADAALLTTAAFFKAAYDQSAYDPSEDQILIPFNKACGTDELNKHIANHIARSSGATTHEVIAGFNKHYFSVGDKVLYEKEDAEITDIKRNPLYAGKWPQPASNNLDYWGCLQIDTSNELTHHAIDESPENVDALLESMAAGLDDEDGEGRVREASHIITVRLFDSEQSVEIKSAAAINSLLLAYALTIHKSQGSEWRKVFLVLHQSHNTMLQRELLYTACTRAKQELYVICEPDSFEKGINGQRIKGNTVEEKANFFKGKLAAGEEELLAIVS